MSLLELTESSSTESTKKHWYVLQVASGAEQSVKKSLEKRIELAGMQYRFGSIVVPTEDVVEMKGGQKRKSERKFYPGYVLIEMEFDDEIWHLVRKTPKVSGFIGGTKVKPAPLTPREVKKILEQMEEGVDKPKPKTTFEPGEVVRVLEGPFKDFNGEVEEVDYQKSRLKVAVLIFGRKTPVELEFGQVEKDKG